MAFFDKGREGFAGKGTLNTNIVWDENKINCILVDMDDAGPAVGGFKVTGCTSSSTTVTVTTSTAHGLAVNNPVEVFSIAGITNVNGVWTVATVPTSTTFTYVVTTAPTGTYTTNTGYIANLSLTYLSDFVVLAGRIATATIPSTGKTVVNGVLDAADVSFNSVTGDPVEAMLFVRGAAAQSDVDLAATAQRLILIQTPNSVGFSGMPLTPDGSNINITFSSSGIARIGG